MVSEPQGKERIKVLFGDLEIGKGKFRCMLVVHTHKELYIIFFFILHHLFNPVEGMEKRMFKDLLGKSYFREISFLQISFAPFVVSKRFTNMDGK